MARGKIQYKSKGMYQGVVSYKDIEYTEEQLEKMAEEFYQIEKSLSKKYKDYDSEYSYELGKVLSAKLSEYKIIQTSRYEFWKMLREYVNKKDVRKTITDKRDAYEYCYMLYQLDRKLVIKYSRSKWDHLFDVFTARKDKRIYDWLLKCDDETLVKSNSGFQNFCKGLKVYLKDIDTEVLDQSELFTIYDTVLEITKDLLEYEKSENVKLNSKDRDSYYEYCLYNSDNISIKEFYEEKRK